MPATNDQQPEFTRSDLHFDKGLSLTTDHAREARQAVVLLRQARAEGDEQAAAHHARRLRRALDRHLAAYRRQLP